METGIERIGKEVEAFAHVLPAGDYLACLFEAVPELVGRDGAPDYFTSDMGEAWVLDTEEDCEPVSGYYRAEDFSAGPGRRLFEFVVPTQTIESLDMGTVETYRKKVRRGNRPTAVSIGVLDVKSSQECFEVDGVDIEPEVRTHWCLAHYVLDGHHKCRASSLEEKPLTLLSFVSVDQSWKQVEQLTKVYRDSGRTR